MPIISAQKLSAAYGEHQIFKNLSFELETGDFLCIVGPNGSGKSTLLKVILGELKPSSGQIQFGDQLQPNFIGYLPQNNTIPDNFPATVAEIVATGLLNRHHFVTKSAKSSIKSALKTLKIEQLAKSSFADLSGGQRQKVLLARALCATSKLLILDEASNNLDYNSKAAFYSTLEHLNRSQKLTIIMVTHDLDHNNLLGNKILSLDRDNPFFGPTTDFVRRLHAH